MVRLIFKVNGGGDRSVGIWDTESTITIEDNWKVHDEDMIKSFKEFLYEWYDIPKHMGSVLTLEEYKKEEDAERKYYEELFNDDIIAMKVLNKPDDVVKLAEDIEKIFGE